jgi:hypothetical protein
MKKLLLWRLSVVLGIIATFFLVTAPALAIWEWCIFDPQLNINGRVVDLNVLIRTDGNQDKLFNGNMVFTITVPRGTDAEVIYCEKKIKVRIVETDRPASGTDGTPVDISLQVKSKDCSLLKLDVSLDKQSIAEVEGTTCGVTNYYLVIP